MLRSTHFVSKVTTLVDLKNVVEYSLLTPAFGSGSVLLFTLVLLRFGAAGSRSG